MSEAMHLRLARTAEEIAIAQRLRYHVFCEEMGAAVDESSAAEKRDADRFDGLCDHLLVIDSKGDNFKLDDGALVGTYRLLPQHKISSPQEFYTQGEFDIAALIARHSDLRFLELGRSCVLKPYRSKRVIELLWQGIWDYVRDHKLDVMLGCASFEGSDPKDHAEALSFLHHFARAEAPWHTRAHDIHFQSMDLIAKDQINAKKALHSLPPLIKGYLRLGCKFGDGCVIDRAFNTVDVLVILPVSTIDPRYFERFGAPVTKDQPAYSG
jgi:L-ornithine Nalpha-acyltransferase